MYCHVMLIEKPWMLIGRLGKVKSHRGIVDVLDVEFITVEINMTCY